MTGSPFTHNMLWTWDSRMRWVPARSNGAAPDMARPDAQFAYPYDRAFFVENYQALIREVARWPEVTHIIIWGFLRDAHGGIEAAREIARFAEDHGVHLLAGIGTSGYGGIYYEGEHEYNAACLLRRRPDLAVRNKQYVSGEIRDRGTTLNPVHPEVVAWVQDGIRWLFDTLPLAGVNLEIGDLFVGDDFLAQQKRAEIQPVEDEFFRALAAHYQLITPDLIRGFPEKLFSFASYSDCSSNILRRNERFLDYLPNDLLCQWTISDSIEGDDAILAPSSRIQTGYAHLFCEANGTQHQDLTAEIAQACRIAHKRRLQGVVIYGEQPAHTPAGTANYQAFRRFLREPELAFAVAPPEKNLIAAPV